MNDRLINPQILEINSSMVAGHARTTTLMKGDTPELWKGFMPNRNIKGRIGENVYSVSILPEEISWNVFNPTMEFTKFAGIMIEENSILPEGFTSLRLPAGKYLVFDYSGSPQEYGPLWLYILTEYLPSIGLQMANGPQYEILNEKIRYGMEGFSEKIFIPVK